MPLDSGSISSRLLIGSNTMVCQHKRVTTGSILTATRADITITRDTAFADTNYSVGLSIMDTSALGLGLQSERIRSKMASAREPYGYG